MSFEIISNLIVLLASKFFTLERPSPKPRFKKEDIVYRKGNVTIKVDDDNGWWWITTVQDTNSMDPLFDIGHILLLQPVTNFSDLIVGDVIIYGERNIIHRITRIYEKDGMRHYKCKGDNVLFTDPYDIMDKDIKYLLRGVLI